jgi:hypothetical protein
LRDEWHAAQSKRSIPVIRTHILLALCLGLLTFGAAGASETMRLASPNGSLVVEFRLNDDGAPRYAVLREGATVLRESKLGLLRDDADFSRGLKLLKASEVAEVKDDYEILTAKRRFNHYVAQARVFRLATSSGQCLDIAFQVSNDGVVFRYLFPASDTTVHTLKQELSSYHFRADTRAWLQPLSIAKSGWKRTNPSYEEFYEKNILVGTPSTHGAGWAYPALFRTQDTWVLVSESSLHRQTCGTRLHSDSPDGEYSVAYPDPREGIEGGPVNPEFRLPWSSPWRVIAIGSLGTLVESTLGVDVADKASAQAMPPPLPGKASWSWPLLGDSRTDYDTQKRFIDYASEMGWRYTLIDALWDTQIGYERMKELVDYAKGRNVSILLWYNSNGTWNDAPQTPTKILASPESRRKEFQKLKDMGIAGLKIDFFGGDGQSMIAYYHDLLEDSARFGLLVNFHGATLPRGWQRSYPNLMTMEAIRGLEYVTFDQKNADQEPTHAAMLPFTRNVFDPMDFTPVVLDRIKRIERRTSSAFELALSILFTSGIQHYAEIPEGMAKAPDYVRDFLRHVPSVWDDVKFVAGEPGDYVVLERRGEGRRYLAGINATGAPIKTIVPAEMLADAKTATLITDGDDGALHFSRQSISLKQGQALELDMQPRGGFVVLLR